MRKKFRHVSLLFLRSDSLICGTSLIRRKSDCGTDEDKIEERFFKAGAAQVWDEFNVV